MAIDTHVFGAVGGLAERNLVGFVRCVNCTSVHYVTIGVLCFHEFLFELRIDELVSAVPGAI